MARWALRSLLTTLVACAVSSSFISADDLAAVGGGAALAAVIPGASAMGSCGPDDKTCKSNHTSDVNGYVDCKACVASGLGWSPVQAKCGEFANRRCWEGSIPTRAELPDFSVLQNCDTCVNAGFGWDEEEEECGFHSTVDCTLSASGYGAAEKERPMPMPSDGKRIDFAQWQDCHSCVAAGFGWCRIKQKCGGFASRSCVGLTPAEPANQEPDDVRKGSDVLASVSGEVPNFGTYTDCNSCIGAGYGWCPIRRKCGGFANKVCGSGESYVASPAAEYTDCLSCVQGGFGWDPHRQLCGNFRNKDCSSENPDFTRFRTCELCVQDGWGWCPVLQKCGGFANKNCAAVAPKLSEAEIEEHRNDLAKLAEERDQEVAQQIEQRLREIDSTASGRVVELSVETFERLAGKRHLLVLFYTNWCGSKCEAFVGQYEEIAKNSVGMQDVVVAKVNADYAADLVPRFEVYNYPAVLFFKKGTTEVAHQFLTKLDATVIAETLHRSQKDEL